MSYFNHFRRRIFSTLTASTPLGVGLLAGLAVQFVANNIAWVHCINGRSMSPSLSPHYHETGRRDWVLVLKRSPVVHRGDVVLFWKPNDPENWAVKRILALPSDVVTRDPRRVEMGREKGHSAHMGMGEVPTKVQVPKNHVWVEGDYWRESNDSNNFGPISGALLVGKAVSIVWPLGRFGAIPQRPSEDASRVVVETGILPHDPDEEDYSSK